MTADSSSSSEFRENTRAPVRAPATIQMDAFSEPKSGYTANVSVGGMFVAMTDPPPVGSIVRYEVELGDPPSPVRGTAEVVWMRTQAQGPDLPAGIGLQFRLIEGDGETLLRTVVQKALAELGPEPEPAPPVKKKPRPPRPPSPPATERPTRGGGVKKPEKKKQKPTAKKKEPTDDGKTILGMPAEKAKLIFLLVLMAFLLLVFLL